MIGGRSGPRLVPRKRGGKDGGKQGKVRPAGGALAGELAEIVGRGTMSRAEVTKRLWDYVRANNLQDPANRREIIADDKLRRVFGRDRVSMFEMSQLIQPHLR